MKFCVLYAYFLVILALIANFQAKFTAQNNKNIFYKYDLESDLAPIKGSGSFIFFKKFKIISPYCTVILLHPDNIEIGGKCGYMKNPRWWLFIIKIIINSCRNAWAAFISTDKKDPKAPQFI